MTASRGAFPKALPRNLRRCQRPRHAPGSWPIQRLTMFVGSVPLVSSASRSTARKAAMTASTSLVCVAICVSPQINPRDVPSESLAALPAVLNALVVEWVKVKASSARSRSPSPLSGLAKLARWRLDVIAASDVHKDEHVALVALFLALAVDRFGRTAVLPADEPGIEGRRREPGRLHRAVAHLLRGVVEGEEARRILVVGATFEVRDFVGRHGSRKDAEQQE